MIDLIFPDYSPEWICSAYEHMSDCDLIAEYRAVLKCLDILLSDSPHSVNLSFLTEYADWLSSAMREEMTKRFLRRMDLCSKGD